MWKVLKFFWKNLKNCSKITKKSLFFPLFGKKSFLNRTLGLRKSFLNQTTYVLKNRLHQQSFLNRDSFLNRAFLNRECTVPQFRQYLNVWHIQNLEQPFLIWAGNCHVKFWRSPKNFKIQTFFLKILNLDQKRIFPKKQILEPYLTSAIQGRNSS